MTRSRHSPAVIAAILVSFERAAFRVQFRAIAVLLRFIVAGKKGAKKSRNVRCYSLVGARD